MRRSSAGGRPSLGPLRVKNDLDSATKPKLRLSSVSSNDGRLSTINSNIYGSGRLSFTGGKRNMTRPSISGMQSKSNRRSIMMSASRGYESVKDPRPVSDRSYRDNCIRELVQFLGDNGYPHPISLKILHAPTSKDFYKIFEFLMHYLQPRYSVGKKAEEEIPGLLKTVGYPFTITKSAMITIGSPHSWPSLLAALMWLKRYIEFKCIDDIAQSMYPSRQDRDAFDFEPQAMMMDSYFGECYRLFLNGEDDFTEHEERFAREFRNGSDGADCESLLAENRRLNEELKALKEQPDGLSAQKGMLLSLELDEQRIQQFLNELEPHIALCTQQLSKAEGDMLDAENELAAVESEIPRKLRIYETQELSQNDVKQINAERQQLQLQIRTMEAENESLDKDNWAEEMALGKARGSLEKTCEKYNRMAQLLQLIPANAENAFGVDYELRPVPSLAESHKFTSLIKPALLKIKAQCAAKVHESRDRNISERDTLEQLSELLEDKNEQLKQLEASIKRSEELIDSKREEFKAVVGALQGENDLLNGELNELHKVRSIKVQDAERQLQQETAEYERRAKQRAQLERRLCAFLNQVAQTVLNHKEVIQGAVGRMYDKVQESLRQTEALCVELGQTADTYWAQLQELRAEREGNQ